MVHPRRPQGPGIAPPKSVGVNVSGDPIVRKYTQGIAARAKEASRDKRVPIPDLAAAAVQYHPRKDVPMTLAEIAVAQENIKAMDASEGRGLSPNTVAGLRALHEQAAAQQAPPTPPTPAPITTQAAEEPEKKEKKSFTKLSDEEKRAAAETSDIDFDVMMSRLRNDVINNEEERKAIDERVRPMDLTDGLISGEFKQHVPITPGKLEVVFRTVSPLENNTIRRNILLQILEDETFSNQSGEELGFQQMVASVHSLNGKEMPSHLRVGDKASVRIFDQGIFDQKLAVFRNYPVPFIHALSTHAYWFDLRVRKLFSSATLKNG